MTRDPERHTAYVSDDTLDALQLHSQPFLSDDEHEALYVDETTDSTLATLRDAITGDVDAVLVLGEPGAGKSSLLQLLDRESDRSEPALQCFMVGGRESLTAETVFGGLLEAFQTEVPDAIGEQLEALVPRLERCAEQGVSCAIVIDDALDVPERELARLLVASIRLNEGESRLIRLVLAGSSELEARIPTLLPDGADVPYAVLGLEPLDAERAAEHLGFRLQEAGLPGALPFSDDDIDTLVDTAAGRPGPLQQAAAELLERRLGSTAPVRSRGRGMAIALPRIEGLQAKLVGAFAVLLILVGLLLFIPEGDDDPEAPFRVTETRPVVIDERDDSSDEAIDTVAGESLGDTAGAVTAATDAERRDLDRDIAAGADRAAAPSGTLAGDGRGDTVDGSDSASADGSDTTDDTFTRGDDTTASTVGDAARTTQDDDPPSSAAPDRSAVSTDAETPSAGASTTASTADPLAEPPSGTASDAAVDADPAAGEGDEAPGEEAPPAEATPTASADTERLEVAELPVGSQGTLSADEREAGLPSARPVPEVEPGSDDGGTADTAATLESPNWVLVQDPERYTIQMVAANDRDSIERFVAEHALEPPNSVFSFERRGRTWHAMVHGLYPTIAAAQAAIEALPEPARVNRPWIRSISRLQQALRDDGR